MILPVTDFTRSLSLLARYLKKKDYDLVSNTMFALHNGVRFGYDSTFDPAMIKDAQDIYNIHRVKKSELFNSIKILVSPWEKGFYCNIITPEQHHEMTTEQHELCNTIAMGMCYAAKQNPDKIFKLGLKASGLKKTKNNLPKKNNSNVIDFLQYLRIKRG